MRQKRATTTAASIEPIGTEMRDSASSWHVIIAESISLILRRNPCSTPKEKLAGLLESNPASLGDKQLPQLESRFIGGQNSNRKLTCPCRFEGMLPGVPCEVTWPKVLSLLLLSGPLNCVRLNALK